MPYLTIFDEWGYNTDIFCPNCKFIIIRVCDVWCGCTPIPRKLKKKYKKMQAMYKA